MLIPTRAPLTRCRRPPLAAAAAQAPRQPAAHRALAGYEDGVCDEERYAEDPDCDSSSGGVPATACARTAGMAAAVSRDGGASEVEVLLPLPLLLQLPADVTPLNHLARFVILCRWALQAPA